MQSYYEAPETEFMAMENVLRELVVDRFGVIAGDLRHQDNYFLSFFGRPGFEDTWAWRFLGHHLSLSHTIIGQGTAHYYRIQGREILIEFDNAIDNGNHIRSVWRDYRNDLGHELLLDHYQHERHHGHRLDTRRQSSVPDD
jgi:hypothetical protein